MIELSTIIVTYNSQDEIEKLLFSSNKFLPAGSEVIVVDNDSSDGTVAEVKQFKNVKLIKNSVNIGYGKGTNLGVRRAAGEYLLLLNPDTLLIDHSVNKMLSFAKSHPEVGIVAPKLLGLNGTIQASVSKDPTLAGAFRRYLFNKKYDYGEYVPIENYHQEVEVVYGAALLVKKEIFRGIGGFDGRYFLYFEDLDLCRKVRGEGLKVVYLPEAQVIHTLGSSVKKDETIQLPFGLRTLSWFVPIVGSNNYQLVKSSYTYYGVVEGFLLRVFLYIVSRLIPKLTMTS